MIKQSLHLAETAWCWWRSEFLGLLPRTYLRRRVRPRLTLLLGLRDAVTEIAVMAA